MERRLIAVAVGERRVAAARDRGLEAGPPPDLILVHTGFNEVGVALANEMLRDGDAVDQAAVEGDQQDQEVVSRMLDQEEINRRTEEFLASDFGPRVAEQAAKELVAGLDDLQELADQYDVPVVAFFQPDATASRHQAEPYEAISNIPTDTILQSPLTIALETTADDLAEEDRMIDLRHLFDATDEQVFLGLVHHNEDGAQLIADAMLPTILDRLDIDPPGD